MPKGCRQNDPIINDEIDMYPLWTMLLYGILTMLLVAIVQAAHGMAEGGHLEVLLSIIPLVH